MPGGACLCSLTGQPVGSDVGLLLRSSSRPRRPSTVDRPRNRNHSTHASLVSRDKTSQQKVNSRNTSQQDNNINTPTTSGNQDPTLFAHHQSLTHPQDLSNHSRLRESVNENQQHPNRSRIDHKQIHSTTSRIGVNPQDLVMDQQPPQ